MPGPVVARGDRVTLRTVEQSDAAFRQRGTTDPRVRHLLGMGQHRNEAEAEGLVEAMDSGGDKLAYVACLDAEAAPPGHPDADDTTRIGVVHAYSVDSERAHLAYWLLPEFHGEGYGRETATLAVDRAFETAPIHSVSAGAFAHNDASRSLLESLGFTEVYRKREAAFVDGDYRDFVEYDLLRREWAEQ
jgi:ribosomal-protein-alanine N-acetyltransferase